jgi:GDPmannose 4,6-dehydratase
MWRIVQQDKPSDYVLATGETHTVREFVELAFKEVGRTITWRGKGLEEVGVDAKSGEVVIEVDPRYFRPTEVDFLLGDPSKAHRVLGWKHTTTFPELVRDMVRSDLVQVKREHDLHGQQHADD